MQDGCSVTCFETVCHDFQIFESLKLLADRPVVLYYSKEIQIPGCRKGLKLFFFFKLIHANQRTPVVVMG